MVSIIKLRLCADNEADAQKARDIVEAALAKYGCRLATPRAGRNPKYADAQKVFSYGELVINAPAPKRKRRVRPKIVQPEIPGLNQKPTSEPTSKQ
jgi:hypothetical protein